MVKQNLNQSSHDVMSDETSILLGSTTDTTTHVRLVFNTNKKSSREFEVNRHYSSVEINGTVYHIHSKQVAKLNIEIIKYGRIKKNGKNLKEFMLQMDKKRNGRIILNEMR
jgi:hypothetical protein